MANLKDEILKKATDTMIKKADMSAFASDISDRFAETLEPMLMDLKASVEKSGQDMTEAIKNSQASAPEIVLPDFPAITIPPIIVPKPEVTVHVPAPIVHVPKADAPIVTFPDSMALRGIDNRHPLPVILTNDKGEPYIAGSFGGAGSRGPVVIRDILNAGGRSVMDETNNAIRVNLAVGSVSLTSADGTMLDGVSSARATVMQLTNLNPQAVAIVDASGNQITSFGGTLQDGQGSLITSHVYGDFKGIDVNLVSALDQTIDSVAVRQVSGFVDSVSVTGFVTSLAASLIDSSGVAYSGSNPLPTTASVSLTLPSGPGDGATATRFIQAGDTVSSVMTSATGLNETTSGVLRVVQMTDSNSSVSASQVGTWNIATLTSITNSSAVALVDSTGVAYSGSNPVPTTSTATLSAATGQGDGATALRIIQAGDTVSSVMTASTGLNETTTGVLRVVQMTDSNSSVSATQVGTWNIGTVTTLTGVTNSLQSALIDSTGIQYSGSNPVPITIVSGGNTSTVAVGDSAARTADNGGNPVKMGGIARTTQPTAYADGDRSNFASDKLGRQLTRPLQIRDLISTAYVSLTTGTEATLLAASAGNFLDLISVVGANQSTAAVQVDIRAVTAGNVVMTLYIPAQSTAGAVMQIPWPQDATGNNWTVDMPDITGTTVNVSALFTKEV